MDKNSVKTRGSMQWGGGGAVQRLFAVRPAGQYSRSGWQAAMTLLEGSKGRAAERQADDVAVVATMRGAAPVLGAATEQQLADDTAAFLAECRRELRCAVQRGRKRARAETVEMLPADGSHSSNQPVVEAAVLGRDGGSAGEAVLERAGQSDVSTVASSLGSDGECDSDGTVSEADSREVETDDSWESDTSAATTDPFGCSPDIGNLEETDSDDAEGTDVGHSPACSDGEQ